MPDFGAGPIASRVGDASPVAHLRPGRYVDVIPRRPCRAGARASSCANTGPHRRAGRPADRRACGRATRSSRRCTTRWVLRHRDRRQDQHGPEQRNTDTRLPHLALLLRTPESERLALRLVPDVGGTHARILRCEARVNSAASSRFVAIAPTCADRQAPCGRCRWRATHLPWAKH
jgi:hypothetical protein